jgi:SpoIID/LytB domain protein
MLRLILITCSTAALWVTSGCSTRTADPWSPSTWGDRTPKTVSPAPTPAPAAPKVKVRPDLRSEPLVRVFLAQSVILEFTLNGSATLPDGRTLASGPHRVQSVAGALQIDGLAAPAECPLTMPAAERRFSAELDPPFGRAQRLSFSGLPILRQTGAQAQLLEEVPLETYLAGVVPTEMNPTWPVEALKAQAIAARSYASAKYLERFDRPWQLHWHYTVDMAYAGVPAQRSAAVTQALAATRGQVLTYHDLPVPALFHACSGGATESASNLWPTLTGADRTTPMAAQMPVVQDPSAEAGCLALGFARSHWRWKVNIPLADITRGVQSWAKSHPDEKLTVGTITGVEVIDRHPDSGRVSQVSLTFKQDGRTKHALMAAQDFRMAIDPGVCRSTWWDRCQVATGKKGPVLVLNGRGFGHGVGLSQVSAWQMAHSGSSAQAIVSRFYPQAALERRW